MTRLTMLTAATTVAVGAFCLFVPASAQRPGGTPEVPEVSGESDLAKTIDQYLLTRPTAQYLEASAQWSQAHQPTKLEWIVVQLNDEATQHECDKCVKHKFTIFRAGPSLVLSVSGGREPWRLDSTIHVALIMLQLKAL